MAHPTISPGLPLLLAVVSLHIPVVATPAAAHPAIGIVIDRTGTVFYSDTRHVWMIRPDGSKAIGVRDVHTHELWLDAEGSLFGEHLWYEGEATNVWRHRVWKRSRDGRTSEVIAARTGFRDDHRDFFFTRDARGLMYWLERASPATICRRVSGGPVQTIATIPLKDPVWLSVTPDGTALVSDHGIVWRVPPGGTARQLPAGVSASRDRLAVMGLASDATGNIYAAAYQDRAVRRVSAAGEVTTVATTPVMWGPTGVAVSPQGTVWILEASITNAQRVRRVDRDGKVRVF
jgi:hypothetical protein